MVERGFSQSTLSRKSGVERTAICRIISGKARPRHEQIGWIAKALGVDTFDLWTAADQPEEVRKLLEQLREATDRISSLERDLEVTRATANRLANELRAARDRRTT
jgi:transcriptional regulator with XRE-family HTH domain